jgi:hypothetical protein
LNTEIDRVDVTRKTVDDMLVKTTTLIIDADDTETKESQYLDSSNKLLTTTLTSVNSVVQNLDKNQNTLTQHGERLIDTSTQTVAAVKPVLEQMKTDLATANGTLVESQSVLKQVVVDLKSANGTLQTANTLLGDPAIPATLHNVQDVTNIGASILKHADGTANDVQQAVHSYLHPTWPVKVLHGVESGIGRVLDIF